MMDPIVKTISVRCRAAILTVERSLERQRYHRSTLTIMQKREALEVRAFRLGQQFKHYGDNPFSKWHHPLAQKLSESFILGAGGNVAQAA